MRPDTQPRPHNPHKGIQLQVGGVYRDNDGDLFRIDFYDHRRECFSGVWITGDLEGVDHDWKPSGREFSNGNAELVTEVEPPESPDKTEWPDSTLKPDPNAPKPERTLDGVLYSALKHIDRAQLLLRGAS